MLCTSNWSPDFTYSSHPLLYRVAFPTDRPASTMPDIVVVMGVNVLILGFAVFLVFFADPAR